jgi:RimJ/RimL family protein N-acetyltransferase
MMYFFGLKLLLIIRATMVKALYTDSLTLHLINEDNLAEVFAKLHGLPDCDAMIQEIAEHYMPEFDKGIRTKYGFYTMQQNELVGFSLLGIDDWHQRKGYTGADTLLHRRGQGIAPRSKPHLFYVAFELLGLNRVATGCLASNLASKRSIEKTPGFQFEGISRESGLNEKGDFEDEYLYAILRSDWLRLYDQSAVRVIS